MADKEVCLFDTLPEPVPRIRLWGSRYGNEVAPDLDMATVYNRSVRSDLLDQWNQAWHLWVIDNDNIRSALFRWNQRSSFAQPVPLGILIDPLRDQILALL